MEKRMYKINLGIAEELVGYMIGLEMEDPIGYDLHYSVVYNGVYNPGAPKIGTHFTMSMGMDGHRLDGDVCVPMIYKDDGFQEKMYWYLYNEYDFDLYAWGMRYGFTFEQSSILFDILHELGHMKNWLHDINEYDGHFKTLDDDYDDKEQLYFVTSEEELFIRYRQLRTESYADKTSVKFLKKYGDTLAQFVKRGLLIETFELNEVDSIILG